MGSDCSYGSNRFKEVNQPITNDGLGIPMFVLQHAGATPSVKPPCHYPKQSPSNSNGLFLLIQRTSHADPWLIQDVGINHGRADIFVTKEFLNGANVITLYQQVCGKGMAQTVAIGTFDDSRRGHCSLECALQDTFGHVMPLFSSTARIDRNSRRRKNILPNPFAFRVRQLST